MDPPASRHLRLRDRVGGPARLVREVVGDVARSPRDHTGGRLGPGRQRRQRQSDADPAQHPHQSLPVVVDQIVGAPMSASITDQEMQR